MVLPLVDVRPFAGDSEYTYRQIRGRRVTNIERANVLESRWLANQAHSVRE